MIRTLMGVVVAFALTTVSSVLFQVAPASAAVVLSDMRAQMTMSRNDLGQNILSLVVNSALFGDDGFALGVFEYPPDPIFPPEPIRWTAHPPDPGMPPPDDGTPMLSFIINDADEVSGVSPNPFRLFMQSTSGGPLADFGSLLELDFSGATGSLGSLNLTGVVLWEVDSAGDRTTTMHAVAPFTITAIPLPAAAWLFLTGLGLFGVGVSRRLRAA